MAAIDTYTTRDNVTHEENPEAAVFLTSRRLKRAVKFNGVYNGGTPPKAAPAAAESEKEEEVTTNTEVTKRRNAILVWSVSDKFLFFEALNEYGKDFYKIENHFQAKCKKIKPTDIIKNKEHIRQFYYRTWHKLSNFVTFDNDTKMKVKELYTLINYGEMWRRCDGNLPTKELEKLDTLVKCGYVTIRPRKKLIRVKTPVCPALLRLIKIQSRGCDNNKMRTDKVDVKFPSKIVIDLRPAETIDWHRVQRTAQNPHIKVSMSLDRKLSTVIKYLSKKWRSVETRALESLPATRDSASSEAGWLENLTLRPKKGAKIHNPMYKYAHVVTSCDISLQKFPNRSAPAPSESASNPKAESGDEDKVKKNVCSNGDTKGQGDNQSADPAGKKLCDIKRDPDNLGGDKDSDNEVDSTMKIKTEGASKNGHAEGEDIKPAISNLLGWSLKNCGNIKIGELYVMLADEGSPSLELIYHFGCDPLAEEDVKHPRLLSNLIRLSSGKEIKTSGRGRNASFSYSSPACKRRATQQQHLSPAAAAVSPVTTRPSSGAGRKGAAKRLQLTTVVSPKPAKIPRLDSISEEAPTKPAKAGALKATKDGDLKVTKARALKLAKANARKPTKGGNRKCAKPGARRSLTTGALKSSKTVACKPGKTVARKPAKSARRAPVSADTSGALDLPQSANNSKVDSMETQDSAQSNGRDLEEQLPSSVTKEEQAIKPPITFTVTAPQISQEQAAVNPLTFTMTAPQITKEQASINPLTFTMTATAPQATKEQQKPLNPITFTITAPTLSTISSTASNDVESQPITLTSTAHTITTGVTQDQKAFEFRKPLVPNTAMTAAFRRQIGQFFPKYNNRRNRPVRGRTKNFILGRHLVPPQPQPEPSRSQMQSFIAASPHQQQAIPPSSPLIQKVMIPSMGGPNNILVQAPLSIIDRMVAVNPSVPVNPIHPMSTNVQFATNNNSPNQSLPMATLPSMPESMEGMALLATMESMATSNTLPATTSTPVTTTTTFTTVGSPSVGMPLSHTPLMSTPSYEAEPFAFEPRSPPQISLETPNCSPFRLAAPSPAPSLTSLIDAIDAERKESADQPSKNGNNVDFNMIGDASLLQTPTRVGDTTPLPGSPTRSNGLLDPGDSSLSWPVNFDSPLKNISSFLPAHHNDDSRMSMMSTNSEVDRQLTAMMNNDSIDFTSAFRQLANHVVDGDGDCLNTFLHESSIDFGRTFDLIPLPSDIV